MSHPAFPGGLTREDPDLNERQREVFEALVRVHGLTARPVGSEALAHQGRIRRSPASIRSAVAELESLGLVKREHASAGPVPSAAGYAFHVRTELTPEPLPAGLLHEVDETLRRSTHDVEQLLNEASRLLSTLTHQLGLAVAASLDRERLTNLEIAALDPQRALLVLSLGRGAARTLVLELESPLDRAELEEVGGVLRERLVGRALSEVRERLADDPELVRRTAVRLVARAAAACLKRALSTVLFSAGAGHIASLPEFAGSEQLGSLLRVVENGPPIDRLMVDSVEGQPVARVGLDEDRALNGCSLVCFPLPGAVGGAVGVLGPLRMNYARALAVVDAVGSRVASYL